MYDFTYKPKDNIMIWGESNEFWFLEILYLFGYDVAGHVNKVFAKVQWYKPLQSSFHAIVTNWKLIQTPIIVKQDTMQQFDAIIATKLNSTDVIDLATAYRPVMAMLLNMVSNTASLDLFLIDSCYYVNKMYEGVCDDTD